MKYVVPIIIIVAIAAIAFFLYQKRLKSFDFNPEDSLYKVGNNGVQLLKTGEFTKIDKNHFATGAYEIVSTPEGKFIQLVNLDVNPGPDLRLCLSDLENPTKYKLVKKGNHANIAVLKSHKGNHVYKIDDNIKIEDYKSVLIWCGMFRTVFSNAAIK